MEFKNDTLLLTKQEVQQISEQEIPVLNNKFLVGYNNVTGDIILTPYIKAEFVVEIIETKSKAKPKQTLSLTSPSAVETKLSRKFSTASINYDYDCQIKTFGRIPHSQGNYRLKEIYGEEIFIQGRLVHPHIIFAKIK